MNVKRGELYYADLSPVVGSEQGGIRPVLIIQNDTGNKHSPTVICAAITSRMNKAKLPTHVELDASRYQLVKDSVVLLEQVRTIDKKRLKEKVCHLDMEILKKVDKKFQLKIAGRKVIFEVTANDECGEILRGKHERFIVNREKFQSKANSKKS